MEKRILLLKPKTLAFSSMSSDELLRRTSIWEGMREALTLMVSVRLLIPVADSIEIWPSSSKTISASTPAFSDVTVNQFPESKSVSLMLLRKCFILPCCGWTCCDGKAKNNIA